MALQDILQKITDEADKKAAFMKQVTEKEVKKIQEEAQVKAEASKSEIEERITVKFNSIVKKSATLAKMTGRSQALKSKREVIDSAYTEMEKELNAMEDADYAKLMIEMLNFIAKSTPKGNLVVPANRKKAVEDAIHATKLDFHVKSESKDIKSGFVVMDGKVEINLSFSYLIQKIVRPATELEVAKILFS